MGVTFTAKGDTFVVSMAILVHQNRFPDPEKNITTNGFKFFTLKIMYTNSRGTKLKMDGSG